MEADPSQAAAAFFSLAARWVRLLFERRSRATPPSPAVAALSGRTPPGDPLTPILEAVRAQIEEAPSSWTALCRAFRLSAVEADLLLVLLTFQSDAKLQRLYAEAGGGGPRLTIGFLLSLLYPSLPQRLGAGAAFRWREKLCYYRLIKLGAAAEGPGSDGRSVEAHERIVGYLAGHAGIDQQLTGTAFLEWAESIPGTLSHNASLQQGLVKAFQHFLKTGSEGRVLLFGPDRGGKRVLLLGFAGSMSRPLLRVDLRRLGLLYEDAEAALQEHLREAVLHDALLYLDAHGCEELPEPTRLHFASVLSAFESFAVVGYDGGEEPPLPVDGTTLRFKVTLPDTLGRQQLWKHFLATAAVPLPEESIVDDVARRYVLGVAGIRDAVSECAARALIDGGALTYDQLSQAGRRRQTHQLGKWAQRVECHNRWEDLIVPDDTLGALDSMVVYVYHADQVFGRWGFARRWSRGAGLSALFYGPPGTGKTMAAALIAWQLEKEIFRIDLSRVTSMWIGETEKNLGEIFEQASLSESILLFDEADSLFARRTEVKNSTDRYANQSVNFLLQKLEEFDGISILTTNRKDSIDEAFRRRLRFQIEFPMPDEAHRTWLWQSMIPGECEVAGTIDWAKLASTYRMGGGNIQNAVLRAAFLAASAGTGLSEDLLVMAANEEYLGLGKLVPNQADGTPGPSAADHGR